MMERTIEQRREELYDALRASQTPKEFDKVVAALRLLEIEKRVTAESSDISNNDNLSDEADRTAAELSADAAIIGLYNKLRKQHYPTRTLVVMVAKAYANAVLIAYQRMSK